MKPMFISRLLTLAATVIFTSAVFANPVLDNVAAGQATVQQTPGNTVIHQTSDRAILNWQSFNIGAGESTHFQQPAGGAALNRINPTMGASQIYGRLTATGQIVLVNPAGIYLDLVLMSMLVV
jgi:filamentous hemagglutinin family protein